MVEKLQASHCQDFNGLACSRYLDNIVPQSMVIVLPDEGERHGKLSSGFSTIIWPIFSRQWQRSRKKVRECILCRHLAPIATPDRLTATLCATDRLTARLCAKASADLVPHRKERRRGTARICEKNSATCPEKSHVSSHFPSCGSYKGPPGSAQFLTLCSASNLAEARRFSSALQGSSPAKTRASSRPSRAHRPYLQPSTNCYKLSE